MFNAAGFTRMLDDAVSLRLRCFRIQAVGADRLTTRRYCDISVGSIAERAAPAPANRKVEQGRYLPLNSLRSEHTTAFTDDNLCPRHGTTLRPKATAERTAEFLNAAYSASFVARFDSCWLIGTNVVLNVNRELITWTQVTEIDPTDVPLLIHACIEATEMARQLRVSPIFLRRDPRHNGCENAIRYASSREFTPIPSEAECEHANPRNAFV